MNSTIWASVIAVAAAFLGALGKELAPDFYSAFKFRGDRLRRIKGDWDVTWYSSDDAKEGEYIKDRITITYARGLRIKGKGRDCKGTYSITGKYNAGRIISFIYEYQGNVNMLAGGGVLELDPLMNECNGYWHGFVKEDKIISGKVKWVHL
jgi:hypothetical protein